MLSKTRPSVRAALVLLATLSGVSACDYGFRLSGQPKQVASAFVTSSNSTPVASVSASASAPPADPLGPRPTLAQPTPFVPSAPEIFTAPNGVTVWLISRPELPVVEATFVVPYGSSSDPADKPGAMALLADMLDEGAGNRTALEVSETIGTLGATLSLYTTLDASFASVTALRSKFDTAFEITADVVARPTLSQKDFGRTHKLWKTALKKRKDDASSVANVVTASVLYGSKTPYGHPSLGLVSKADNVDLDSLKALYKSTWRPDRATLVIAGQITKAEVLAMLDKHLGSWHADGQALAAPKLTSVLGDRPKLVVVDRPTAVQTVLVLAREGVAASDERGPSLNLINTALGGSFTSRLVSNLREEKNWTYGVRSVFSSARGQGTFYVKTSVEAQYTLPATMEILGELSKMSESGLTADEFDKVRAQDRADLVETYEAATSAGERLASLAGMGLPAGFDAAASRLRQAASKDELDKLARVHVDPNAVTIVMVGDKTLILEQLKGSSLPAPVFFTTEGQPEK